MTLHCQLHVNDHGGDRLSAEQFMPFVCLFRSTVIYRWFVISIIGVRGSCERKRDHCSKEEWEKQKKKTFQNRVKIKQTQPSNKIHLMLFIKIFRAKFRVDFNSEIQMNRWWICVVYSFSSVLFFVSVIFFSVCKHAYNFSMAKLKYA